MTDLTSRRPSLSRVFAWPCLFALLTGAGLVSALLGDSIWDWLSWLALGLPLVVIGWFGFVRAPSHRPAQMRFPHSSRTAGLQ